MNLVEVIGNLGTDPEQRHTATGQKVTSFRLADRQKRGDREEVIWWRITIWGNAYERLIPHLKKGSAISVHGDMKTPEIYKDREGRPKVSLELRAQIIRFVPSARSDREEGGSRPERSGQESGQNSGGQVDYTPHERPGGFTPGKGRADDDFGAEEDDRIPF